MPFFDHAGLRFHYEERGTGRPFIFQHGLGGDTAQPLGLLRPSAGMRLIAFDCRGHGLTPPGPADGLTFEALTGDWLALMDHLGLDQAIAGGISLGAALALRVALQHPARIRALVLVRPAWLDGGLADANLAMYALIARLIREHGLAQAQLVFAGSFTYQALRSESPAAAEAFMRQFESAQAEAAVARLERLPAEIPHPRADWARLHAPVLILACRDDRLHPFEVAQDLASGLPGAELIQAASRHADAARHAADVQRETEAFLARHNLTS
jgi:pimeloyl-ACP methyl ester carboxylesterase